MSFNNEQRIREAVLMTLCAASDGVEQLQQLTQSQWRTLLPWLDVSGLALYLLDRLTEIERTNALPDTVLRRLQQNARDNTERTHSLLTESVAIQQMFQQLDVTYAVMKGVSLCPASVPQLELRHQFDLDYLIAEQSAPEARRLLQQRGYRLHAVSGKSWEFKKNATQYVPLKDLYKKQPSHFVELHIEPNNPGQSSRLNRLVHREIAGMTMPVFSPVDLFIAQALHAFKDVCSAFSRTAHLLEFRRHILHHRENEMFWQQLRIAAEANGKTVIAIGVVTHLITTLTGDFAPRALTKWTVAILPPPVRLWVDRYGRRVVFGGQPGSKLYLLLQKELEAAGMPGKRTAKASLLPSRMPPAVIATAPHEALASRVARHWVQVRYIASRARFHTVEGVRYAFESYRWRQQLNRLES